MPQGIEGLERRRPEGATRTQVVPSRRTALVENPLTYGQPGGLDAWSSPKWEEHRVNRTKGKFSPQRQLPPARDRQAHKWRGTGIDPALDTDWNSPRWSDNRTQLETRNNIPSDSEATFANVAPDQMATAPSSGPPPAVRKRALDVARRILAADATMIGSQSPTALAQFGYPWGSLDGKQRRIYFPGRFRDVFFDVLTGEFEPREESDLSPSKAKALGREITKLAAADAEFKESDVKRDDEGKFASQAGGGKAAKGPHRKAAQPVMQIDSPRGVTYMVDEDRNTWWYSEKRDAWLPTRPGSEARLMPDIEPQVPERDKQVPAGAGEKNWSVTDPHWSIRSQSQSLKVRKRVIPRDYPSWGEKADKPKPSGPEEPKLRQVAGPPPGSTGGAGGKIGPAERQMLREEAKAEGEANLRAMEESRARNIEQAAQPKTSPEDAKAHGTKLAEVGSEWTSPDGQKHRVYFKGKFRDVFYDVTEGRFNSRYGSGISREETEALGKELLKKAGIASDAWASPSWATDESFSEADIKRNQKGQFTSGSGAAKPPFEKGSGARRPRLAPASGKRARKQTRSTEGPLSSWGRWMGGIKRAQPGETRSYQIRINDVPRTLTSRGGAIHVDRKAQDAARMAQDGVRLATLALAAARRVAAQAASQAPARMAFDRAMFRGALPSQVMRIRLAYDQHSVRTFSPDGHMHVALSNISRAQVSPYWGKEIPDADQLGLDPARKYMLLRHPDELAQAAPTFNGIPILAEHQPISSDDHPHELVIGATGTDARWEPPFLVNSLHFWAKPAIDAIRTGKQRELSCAYHYVPVMQPGVYEGVRYDGLMTQIHGNHVALVEDGRVGPAAVVADALPFDLRYMAWLGKREDG